MNKSAPAKQNHPTETPASAPALGWLRKLWEGTCIRFTVLAILSLLLYAILSDSLTETYVDTVQFFLLLPFSLCLSAAKLVRKAEKLPTAARCCFHVLLSLGGFYVFAYLPYQIRTKPDGGQILMILLLAAVVYGVCAAVLALTARKAKQKKIDETPYVSQFRKP